MSMLSAPVRQKDNKYNKITQQKKFHLLNLIFKDRIPIRQAANIAGINYLTAKTILFFHKNNCKSYRFDINCSREGRSKKCVTAAFSIIKKVNDINDKLIKPKSRMQVICSIGNVLSPPKEEQVRSPTTCSNYQDKFILKPPHFRLEQNQVGVDATSFCNNLEKVDFRQLIQGYLGSCLETIIQMKNKQGVIGVFFDQNSHRQ